jgi:hypothetical protein
LVPKKIFEKFSKILKKKFSKKIFFPLQKMAASTSLLAFPLSLVGYPCQGKRCRSWFFALSQPSDDTLHRLASWLATTKEVKFACYAFEQCLDGTPALVGYFDFFFDRSLRCLSRIPGLIGAEWLLRNSRLNDITPEDACSFIEGHFEHPTTHQRKGVNPTFVEWGQRSQGRGRKVAELTERLEGLKLAA